MTMRIVEPCVGCLACPPLCPTGAIREKKGLLIIDPGLCVDCEGHFDQPQCVEVCPIEGAIVNEAGRPLNPPGSLLC